MRIIGLSLTLLPLFGITFVAFVATEPAFPGAEVAVLIGFVLLIANVAGSLAASSELPRLTGYLIVGSGIVALGMAVIIGNILGGPILLKRALLGMGPPFALPEESPVAAVAS